VVISEIQNQFIPTLMQKYPGVKSELSGQSKEVGEFFKELGFSKQRIDHLDSTEIVGMIEKYKKFYLPSQIDFGIEKAVE